MSSPTSSEYSTLDTKSFLIHKVPPPGTYKVRFSGARWDYYLDVPQAGETIDMSLVLPHYRARNQPIDHRMNIFVGNETGPVKLKICRNVPRTRFCLEVAASTSEVTVWLPSDFRGSITHAGKATFSAGFVNEVLPSARINQKTFDIADEEADEDVVIVSTQGVVNFRMWDVRSCAVENPQRETIKRMFGRKRRTIESPAHWDFLIEN
ncbi:hypothetical protein BD626DRAFT_436491 [Schizophyllum amplum]|uniref:DUF7330 domain-containing protein n=1 Tax=Schizophyllum amplum TaxID=97359 RepID=A0A550C542_9AGAR|nr:hypothetical protein BD626DRAFT_436491 [Auriculariopsis ampla]